MYEQSGTTDLAPRPVHVPEALVVDFDFYNPPGAEDDIQLAWKRIQEEYPPIFWTPHYGGHWVATHGEDIKTIQLEHERFSQSTMAIPLPVPPRPPSYPINLDPPEQAPYRKLIMGAFLPKAINELTDTARSLAISLIEDLAPKGRCEFQNDFARVLPVVVFLKMMGLPLEDRRMLTPLAETSVRDPDPHKKGEAQHAMARYVEGWIEEARKNPGSDLLSRVVTAEINGRAITHQEQMSVSTLLLAGGLDTVASSMGFVALFLAQNPNHRARLRNDPAILPAAIEELLRRFIGTNTVRVIRYDFTYKGVDFKKGDIIQQSGLLYNLDEAINERPLEVDFDRQGSIQHVSFGSGVHTCPGQILARREISVFIEEWLKRIPEFEVTPGTKPELRTGMVNGVTELQLSWPTS